MIGAVAATIAAMLLIALFQDNLTKFFLKPATPFQVSPRPAGPHYRDPGAWRLWPVKEPARAADIFYIHSTTYYSAQFWNAPLDDDDYAEETLKIALPNEAGPFSQLGRVFAPNYRQATRAASFTHKYHGMAARELALEDVSAAFERFLSVRSPETPIILVGYEQGAVLALGLLTRYFDSGGPDQGDTRPVAPAQLRKRLVAAYLIDETIPASALERLSLPVCSEKRAIRCVVAYNHVERRFADEIARARSRAVVWDGDMKAESLASPEPVCVNPVTWQANEQPSSREDHVGAASATGIEFGAMPPAVAKAVVAQCVGGVLVVEPPSQDYFRRAPWFKAKWRAQPFNLFFHDIAENAALRTAALGIKMREEAQFLEPIEETVDIIDSPINKVPTDSQ